MFNFFRKRHSLKVSTIDPEGNIKVSIKSGKPEMVAMVYAAAENGARHLGIPVLQFINILKKVDKVAVKAKKSK